MAQMFSEVATIGALDVQLVYYRGAIATFAVGGVTALETANNPSAIKLLAALRADGSP